MKRRIVIIFLSILTVMILAIVGLFAYLQLSLFDVKPIMKSALSQEVSKVALSSLKKEENNHYNYILSYKAINDEVTQLFIQEEEAADRSVVSANFNIYNKEAYINYRKGNLYIPVYAKVLIESTPSGMNLNVIPLSYGTKKVDLPAFMDDFIFHDLFVEPIVIPIAAKDYFDNAYLEYESCQLMQDGLQINFIFELPFLTDVFKQIEEGLDTDFISVYREGTPTQIEAMQWMDIYASQPDVVLGRLFEDFRNKGPVLKDLLALDSPTIVDTIYSNYPFLEKIVARTTVDQTRVDLNGTTVLKYGQKILDVYDRFVADKTIVFAKHEPFDSTTLKGITIDTLNTFEPLGFESDLLKQLKLTANNSVVNVLYTTDDGMHILLQRDHYKLLTQQEYDSDYKDPVFSDGLFQVDTVTYEAIYYAVFNLYQSDVFFRYLKDDGNEAFAIVSKVGDYQNFDVIALSKKSDGSYKVIDYGIVSVDTFHKKHPDFNLNLVTRMFENTTLLLLNGKTKTNIFEGVVERGYATDGEEMIYCSYDGNKYISIMLSSGEKYIYTLYKGSFLEELYPLDEALKTFDDIPPIILIQDIPESMVIN